MARRERGGVRAWGLAGMAALVGGWLGGAVLAGPPEPLPAADAGARRVEILDLSGVDGVAVEVRGEGEDRVRVLIRNASRRRLHVVLPPGLVAAAGSGQFQSMGLGSPTLRSGSFGRFRDGGEGLRSVPVVDSHPIPDGVIVPAEQDVSFAVPAVCLNFGVSTPTDRDRFRLMSAEEYSPDPRIGKALRGLVEIGTSQGVAQATMWHVCNGLSYQQLLSQTARKLNVYELNLASRFVAALDDDRTAPEVDPANLARDRVLVHLDGEGLAPDRIARLAEELAGVRLLGLPVRLVTDRDTTAAAAPALMLAVSLKPDPEGSLLGQVSVRYLAGRRSGRLLGTAKLPGGWRDSDLTGAALADAIDRAVARSFVAFRPGRRSTSHTTYQVENRLPFTLARVVLTTGTSSGPVPVALPALGVGPMRGTSVPIQADKAAVDRVELNGL